jgi:hypothetical protein
VAGGCSVEVFLPVMVQLFPFWLSPPLVLAEGGGCSLSWNAVGAGGMLGTRVNPRLAGPA